MSMKTSPLYTIQEKLEILSKLFFNQLEFGNYLNKVKRGELIGDITLYKINGCFDTERKNILSRKSDKKKEQSNLFFKDL